MSSENVIEFAAATAAILATPGPANTLLATAGATVGLRRSLRLIPMECLGYATAISVWIGLGRPLVSAHPTAASVFRAMVVVYLLYKAFHLWKASARGLAGQLDRGVITKRFCFTTAVSNPKALIFAFFIFPPFRSATEMLPFAAIFTGLAMFFASCWICLGVILGKSFIHGGAIVARVASITLATFAMILMGSMVMA